MTEQADNASYPDLADQNASVPLKREQFSQVAIVNKASLHAGFSLKDLLENTEVSYIMEALKEADGVVSHAADKLGLRRTTLIEKMKKYQILK